MPILRRIPNFKGKFRITRIIHKDKIRSSRDEILTGKYGLQYKVPNLKESIGFSLFANGIYEEENVKFILRHLPENSTFLDLGANIGSICIPVSKLRPDVKIIAVEASSRVFNYLRFNVEINHLPNIQLINLALTDRDDELITFYTPDEKFGKGSMNPLFTHESEQVKTITVDTLVKKFELTNIKFIKIDVEGYESIVFKGARQLLTRGVDAPIILFEYAGWAENKIGGIKPGESQRILISTGYSIYNLDRPRHPLPVKEIYESGHHMLVASKVNL